MHRFVADLMRAAPQARVHLMGHSFGCIVVSSIVGGREARQALPRQVDSVALIQGAVSLWAFGDSSAGSRPEGLLQPMGAAPGRSRPGRCLAVDSRPGRRHCCTRGRRRCRFPTDRSAPTKTICRCYGAIGAFGIRGLPDVVSLDMLDKTGAYRFQAGKVYNLQASRFIAKGGGASGAHSDIDGPEVAHALWQAALV